MSVTAEQVENALKATAVDGYRWGYDWNELEWEISRGRSNTLTIDGVEYDVKVLESESGGEGDWETEVYVVFSVGEQVFRITGTYASHVGTEWEGPLEEVHKVKKVVKVWERKS